MPRPCFGRVLPTGIVFIARVAKLDEQKRSASYPQKRPIQKAKPVTQQKARNKDARDVVVEVPPPSLSAKHTTAQH